MMYIYNFYANKIWQNAVRLALYAAILVILLLSSGCTGSLMETENRSVKTEKFTAAVWNVQSLFDGEDTGYEYAEFRSGAGWTGEKYQARLLSAAQAIAGMDTEGPDFAGLVELENAGILEDLLQGPLSKKGYNHAFFGNAKGMSLGIGVISRFPLTNTRVHSITMNGETVPRPILEVHVQPGGEPLIFLICHWKSKVGGEDQTEQLRQASARIINRRLAELTKENPGTPVIIMGDLNENHDEFYRRSGSLQLALIPDDPRAAKEIFLTEKNMNSLILSREKPPRTQYFDSSFPVLYTPWENELDGGSYYYRENWETIDHILMTAKLFDEKGWDFDTCRVLNVPPFTNAKGLPNSYNPRNGLGLSDHLPLLLCLKRL